MSVEPICVECGKLGVVTPGAAVYPRMKWLWRKWFYVCPCGAKVGCHGDSKDPLGRPGGKKTQDARRLVHTMFDPLWLAKEMTGMRRGAARGAAYKWLAEQLQIPRDDCHISFFNAEMALRAAEICRPHYAKLVEKGVVAKLEAVEAERKARSYLRPENHAERA